MVNAPIEQIQKIKDHLRAQIFRGELSEGTRIVEAEIRGQTQASVRAVKRALVELAREGLLSRKRHVGTFVAANLPTAVYSVLPRVHSIGILTSCTQQALTQSYFTSMLLSGIRSALHAPAVVSTMTNAYRQPVDDVPLVDTQVIKNTLQGLIGIEANNAAVLGDLVRAGLPVVAIDFFIAGHQFDVAMLDHQQAGYMATRHLASLGHRKIAYVGEAGNPHSSDPAWQDRLTGYLRAISEGTGATSSPLVMDAQRNELQLRRVCGAFFDEHKPTAFVTSSVGFARTVVEILAEKGLHWPADYSIASADGAFSLGSFPDLSAVRVDHEQLGRIAVRMLASRMACPSMPPVRYLLPVSFAARQSSAPPTR